MVKVSHEFVKMQIDKLPENALEKTMEFITFQRFSLGLYNDDTDYLMSVPGMAEKIKEGMRTPLSDCVSLSEAWGDV